jgi:hypothetical protein
VIFEKFVIQNKTLPSSGVNGAQKVQRVPVEK